MEEDYYQEYRSKFVNFTEDQQTAVLILAVRYLEQLLIRKHSVICPTLEVESKQIKQSD
jgi:hypothetical protein